MLLGSSLPRWLPLAASRHGGALASKRLSIEQKEARTKRALRGLVLDAYPGRNQAPTVFRLTSITSRLKVRMLALFHESDLFGREPSREQGRRTAPGRKRLTGGGGPANAGPRHRGVKNEPGGWHGDALAAHCEPGSAQSAPPDESVRRGLRCRSFRSRR